MKISRLALLAGLWCALASCSRTHSELGDSSTHWLKRCGSDDQCGGLSCLCGVCSTECSESRECRGLGASAVCAAGPSAECGATAAPRACDLTCQRDADCGSGLACVAQRCRRAAAEPMPVSTPSSSQDAGSSSGRDAGANSSEDASVPEPTVRPGPQAACAPQRAMSNGTECASSFAWSWNGAGCEPVVCGCTGDDCAAILPTQPTREACEAAFASCRPTSVCSGLPWYQCFDNCPSRFTLQGGGRSFGECRGDCKFELRFNPIAPSMGSCSELAADLTIFNSDGSQRVINMALTDQAWQQAARLSLALEGATFAPVTGCPDCTDGGEAWVSRSSGSDLQTFRYDYNQPPPGLQAYDSLIQQLIDQARLCQGNLLQRCGSYSAQPSARCGKGLAIADTSCECSVSFAQLSTLNGKSCSASCGSCTPPGGGTCGATCIQPCAGGEPVWSTWCTE